MAPKDKYLLIAEQRAKEKKTHVSFPQLKYPSLRDEGYKDTVQWLTGKAMDDGAEGLWRVNNGIYDLNDFVKRHPGGAEWLELTKGTDITEAFMSHHLNPYVEKMLEKFYVREAKTPRNSPFTFKDDGFYLTLKRDVIEELKKVPSHIPKYTDMITDGMLTTMLLSSALACWAINNLVVNAAYLVASFSLAFLSVNAHNYLHRKTNWRMYLFNFSLWSYRDFRVSHVLSHHLYPNTLMDLEISTFEPVIWWNPRKTESMTYKFAVLFELIIYPIGFIIFFTKRLGSIFFPGNFVKQHYCWHDNIGFLLPIWMYVASGATLSETILMWLWINCTGSCIFFWIGSTAAHNHPKIFHDGDEVRNPELDWGMHELETLMDRADINGNHFKVMTFFGEHALHHLFPTLDHAILPYLHPVLLKNCQKFKANFRLTSFIDLFIGQIQQTLRTEPNLLDDN